jgi:hypothetical protein
MSSNQSKDHLPESFLQPLCGERRSRVRFPLGLQVRCRTLERGSSFAGVGRVVNMSSGGVLVACQHNLSAGTRMELNVEWPSLLDGRIPLQLVMVGRIVRSTLSGFAVVSDRQYQFRTTRRTVIPIDLFCGEAGKQAAKSAAGA